MALQQLADWLFTPFQHIEQKCSTLIHRRLLVISGDNTFCDDTLHQLTDSAPSAVLISAFNNTGKRKHILGTECDVAVVDCRDRFSSSDVMAVAGTIRHQGSLVLLCPALRTWANSANTTNLSHGYHFTQSLFIKRFVQKIGNSPSVAFYYQDAPFSPPAYLVAPAQNTRYSPNEFASDDQAKAFEKLVSAASVLPIKAVVTAPRGRGKSALLGLVLSELIKDGKRILITSSLSDNVKQVFEFAYQKLITSDDEKIQKRVTNELLLKTNREQRHIQYPKNTNERNETIEQYKCRPGELKWVAPDSDALSPESICNYDMVVIDEAASFPLPLLSAIIDTHDNWIMSSTTDGYEGSGNGFMQKLFPSLVDHTNAGNTPIHITLDTPLRWFVNDPLEALLRDTCLFKSKNFVYELPSIDVESSSITNVPDSAIAPIFWFGRFEMLCDDDVCQVMHLLRLAHYQTTPDDLTRLYDSPDLYLATLRVCSSIIAAVVINIEGGSLLKPLAEAIASGRRRPKGHLSAQRLALLSANPTLASLTYWRINRIAVVPALQGKGLGTTLMSRINEQAVQHCVDAITTSYGTTTQLDNFWHGNGFRIVDKGRKKNKASGETSALAILPLTAHASQIVECLVRLTSWVATYHSSGKLTEDTQTTLVAKLQHFVQGSRTLDDVWQIVNVLAQALENKQTSFMGIPINYNNACTSKLIDKPDLLTTLSNTTLNLNTLKNQLNASGQKDVSRQLRLLIGGVLCL